MKWRVTAEHTQGRSVGHPCTDGVYGDPTEYVNFTFEGPEQEAWEAGNAEIIKQRAEAEPCKCGKSDRMHSDAWLDSAAPITEPADDEARQWDEVNR